MSAVVPAAITPCTGPLSPLCQAAGGVGSGLLGSGVGGVLGALSSWVADGAAWLIGQIGGVLSSSTTIDLGAGWFTAHYRTMVGLAAVVLLPLLLLSVIQAVYRQSVAGLVRVVAVQLPLALVLAGAAVELVQLALAATDALSTTISSGSGTDVQQALSQVASALASQAAGGPAPAFVVLLGALLVAFGAFMLWVELPRAGGSGLRGRALPPPGPGQNSRDNSRCARSTLPAGRWAARLCSPSPPCIRNWWTG